MHDNKKDSECQTIEFSVYVLWCSKTDMHYIGVTGRKVEQRILEHKRGKKQFLHKEIQRIGWDGNWDWWVVESDIPANLISEREQYWIQVFDSLYPNGYNRTIGGIKHFKHSKATFTQETRDKMRQAHLGKKRAPFTEEHIANLSKAKMGEKNNFYGKHHTEEAKEKNRQAHIGIPHTKEHNAKIGKAGRGRKVSEKTRAILRERTLASWAAKRAAKEAQETP